MSVIEPAFCNGYLQIEATLRTRRCCVLFAPFEGGLWRSPAKAFMRSLRLCSLKRSSDLV